MIVKDILISHKQGFYKPGKQKDGDVHFVRISDINHNFYLDKETTPMIEADESDIRRFDIKKGDFLFARTGGAGKFCLIQEDIDGIFASYLIRFRFNDDSDNAFLRYFFMSDSFQDELKSKIHGGVNQNVHAENIKDCHVPEISILEQKQIVVLLDKVFTAINQAKANIEKNIENTKELFQSKINAIFSQKSDGWEEKTLGEVCENLDSKRVPITKNKRVPGEIPYYGASGIVDYVVDYLFDEELLLVSEDGANLLARTYPIAFSISGKNWVNNHAHVLKFKNKTSQIFIEYYLNSIKLDDYISGMAQPKLNQRMLNSISVPFPSIEIQEKVVYTVEKLSAQTQNINNQYEQKLINLEELKKSILQKAFAGELTKSKDLLLTAEQKHALLIILSYSRHKNAGKELTFGHTKSEKMIHMFENYAGIDLDRNPIKDAAGPNHFDKVINIIEPLAKKEKYFSITKEDKRYTYGFARNSFKGINKLESQLSALEKFRLEHVISLFLEENTEQSELYATVYAAWNNLLIKKEEITDEAIVYEARENWHPKKLQIKRSKFFETIKKLKTNNIIPEGNGKLVDKKTLF